MRQHRAKRVGITLLCGTLLGLSTWVWAADSKNTRIVYPQQTELDFEGQKIEGELKNPSEFYFQRLPEEKFKSLVQSRKQFHREMLRDAILSR